MILTIGVVNAWSILTKTSSILSIWLSPVGTAALLLAEYISQAKEALYTFSRQIEY